MPSRLIEMQKDSARLCEWAEGRQMGAFVHNWKIRHLGRRNPNRSPMTTGIWTIRHSKVKRFHSHCAPLFHVYISVGAASKRAAFCQVYWQRNILKIALQAEISILFKLTAWLVDFWNFWAMFLFLFCFLFQQILSSHNKVREGPGRLIFRREARLLNHTCKLSLGEMPAYLRTA